MRLVASALMCAALVTGGCKMGQSDSKVREGEKDPMTDSAVVHGEAARKALADSFQAYAAGKVVGADRTRDFGKHWIACTDRSDGRFVVAVGIDMFVASMFIQEGDQYAVSDVILGRDLPTRAIGEDWWRVDGVEPTRPSAPVLASKLSDGRTIELTIGQKSGTQVSGPDDGKYFVPMVSLFPKAQVSIAGQNLPVDCWFRQSSLE